LLFFSLSEVLLLLPLLFYQKITPSVMDQDLQLKLSNAYDAGKAIRFKRAGIWSEPGYLAGGLAGKGGIQDGVIIEIRDSDGKVLKKELLMYSDDTTEIEIVD
jgi:hypothetical protein